MKRSLPRGKRRNKVPDRRDNRAWRNWCEAVLQEVRFRPDHPAIWRELMDHLEDGCADLERLGYGTEMAEQRVLDAMGSAFLVGAAMDKAHHPFWGWLWQLSRGLVLALAVTAAVTLFGAVGFPELAERTASELRWEEPPATAARAELEHAVLYAAPRNIAEEDGQVKADIELWIEMRDPLIAGTRPETWYFTYRDDRGELESWYSSNALVDLRPESRYWEYDWSEEKSPLMGWTRFHETVRLTLDETPEWAEISYPTGGADWVLRVEWEDGV